MNVTECVSDTEITSQRAWEDDIADGAGLEWQYAIYNTALDDGAWYYQNEAPNYYDNVAAYYALYYRSGIDDYLTAARTLADRFWTAPTMDRGQAGPDHKASIEPEDFRIMVGAIRDIEKAIGKPEKRLQPSQAATARAWYGA